MVIQIILIAFALIVVFLVSVISDRRGRSGFDERFPPISDAEFVERCGPGTDPEVALKVRRIVSDTLGVEYERIYPSSRFVDDLGAD